MDGAQELLESKPHSLTKFTASDHKSKCRKDYSLPTSMAGDTVPRGNPGLWSQGGTLHEGFSTA